MSGKIEKINNYNKPLKQRKIRISFLERADYGVSSAEVPEQYGLLRAALNAPTLGLRKKSGI